jgi:hypothetical protein
MEATWIITMFVLINTAMINLDHQTDVRAGVPDSEVVTVALVAAKYFATIHRIDIHRTNMTPHTPAEQQRLRLHRKHIENCHSQLEKIRVARLHARLSAGVSLKIAASLRVLSVSNHY